METVGRYSLIQKLATGGMAEVFLARADGPMGFQKKLVVKRILPHLADDTQFVEMFLQEAKLAAQLEHPNIVQVFDFGQSGKDYFLAMEFVDGANLRTLNAKARALLGPLEPALCARLVTLACEGLAYAHNVKSPETGQLLNLVHRDISPDNILVSRTGAVKVADFGIARVETPLHRTKSGVLKGKLAYMPPEQLGRQTLDRRVDVYALGVVLYELLCGGMPFDATSEVSIIQAVMSAQPLTPVLDRRADVPHALARIVSRALEKNRDERYPDTKAMQADLERFIQDTGRVVGASEIATFFAELDAADVSSKPVIKVRRGTGESDPDLAFGSTKQSQPGLVPGDGTGFDKTDMSSGISDAAMQAPDRKISEVKPRRTSTDEISKAVDTRARTPWIVFGVMALLGGVGSAIFLSTQNRGSSVVEVDAGTAPQVVVIVPAAVDAGAAREAVDAGAVAVAVALPQVDAGEADAVAKGPTRVRVEFRVRPWANVFVDGKEQGTTPLALTLTTGHHKVILTHPKFKQHEVDVLAKPGGIIVQYNFNE